MRPDRCMLVRRLRQQQLEQGLGAIAGQIGGSSRLRCCSSACSADAALAAPPPDRAGSAAARRRCRARAPGRPRRRPRTGARCGAADRPAAARAPGQPPARRHRDGLRPPAPPPPARAERSAPLPRPLVGNGSRASAAAPARSPRTSCPRACRVLVRYAGDIELVLGARHRHIELAPIFAPSASASASSRMLERLGDVRRLARRRGQNSGGRRCMIDRAPVAPRLGARRIGEDDDRRLEPLGAMHGHHPHAAARLGQLALDGHLASAAARRGTPAATAAPRCSCASARSRNSATHVVDLGAEPRAESPQPALGIEHVGVEVERPVEIEPAAPARAALDRPPPDRPDSRPAPAPPTATSSLPRGWASAEQIVLAHLEQRRAQQRRELQIVGRVAEHVAERHQVEHRRYGVVTAQPVGARRRRCRRGSARG